jgi:hypothetical protein
VLRVLLLSCVYLPRCHLSSPIAIGGGCGMPCALRVISKLAGHGPSALGLGHGSSAGIAHAASRLRHSQTPSRSTVIREGHVCYI